MHLKQMYRFLSIFVLANSVSVYAMDSSISQKREQDNKAEIVAKTTPIIFQQIEEKIFMLEYCDPKKILSQDGVSHEVRRLLVINGEQMIAAKRSSKLNTPAILFTDLTDNKILFCEGKKDKRNSSFHTMKFAVRSLAFLNKRIFFGTDNGMFDRNIPKIYIFEDEGMGTEEYSQFKKIRALSLVNELQHHDKGAVVGLYPENNGLISISSKGEIGTWSGKDYGKGLFCSENLPDKQFVVSTYLYSQNDSKYLILGLSNGSIKVVDYNSKKAIFISVIKEEKEINKIDVCDGRLYVASLCGIEYGYCSRNSEKHQCVENNKIYLMDIEKIINRLIQKDKLSSELESLEILDLKDVFERYIINFYGINKNNITFLVGDGDFRSTVCIYSMDNKKIIQKLYTGCDLFLGVDLKRRSRLNIIDYQSPQVANDFATLMVFKSNEVLDEEVSGPLILDKNEILINNDQKNDKSNLVSSSEINLSTKTNPDQNQFAQCITWIKKPQIFLCISLPFLAMLIIWKNNWLNKFYS